MSRSKNHLHVHVRSMCMIDVKVITTCRRRMLWTRWKRTDWQANVDHRDPLTEDAVQRGRTLGCRRPSLRWSPFGHLRAAQARTE